MSRLFFVRHGETPWNAARRLQGQTDVPLRAAGRAQALMAKELLTGTSFDLEISSDLARASETAALLGLERVTLDRRWREIDVGEWAGESVDALRAANPDEWRAWRAGAFTPPSGETGENFRSRISAALASLRPDAGRILIVTHGGVIRASVSLILGVAPDRLAPVRPGSLTILDTGSWPRLRAYGLAAGYDLSDAAD